MKREIRNSLRFMDMYNIRICLVSIKKYLKTEEEMKKPYQKCVITIVYFKNEDVLATSNNQFDPADNDIDWDWGL